MIEKGKQKDVNWSLTKGEKTGFRVLIGSMGWISRQTRLDVMVNVSMASKTLGCPSVRDAVELNKAVKTLQESPDEKWRFGPSRINLNNSICLCGLQLCKRGGDQVAMWLCEVR